MKRILLAACLCLAFCGCDDNQPQKPVNNIIRVFYSENGRGHYTAFVQDPNTKEVHKVDLGYGIKTVADCPADKMMWVDIKDRIGSGKEAVLHIHDGSDLEGGRTGGKHPKPLRPVE